MKKTIIFITLILSCIQLSIAQKINLTYKIKTNDSLYVFDDNALSDKDIETNFHTIFPKNIQNKNIISIEDNINRRFEKTEINHISYYPKLLNDGYFHLYELEVNNKSIYLIYSKNDTLILEKKDSISDHMIIHDKKYNNKLVILSKDYPDLWEKASKVNFRKEELSNFISNLNLKYSSNNTIKRHENSRFDYLNLSLKGFVQKNKTDVMIDILMSHYFINLSPNVSLRYGMRSNYIQQTEFFPELSSGWYMRGSDGIRTEIFIYRDHYETMTGKSLEIPVSVNFEITNSKFTPYFYAGISPALYFRKISRTDSNEIDNISAIALNAFAAAGLKLKLTNSFNILSEYKFDIYKGLNFEVGIEYCFKLH